MNLYRENYKTLLKEIKAAEVEALKNGHIVVAIGIHGSRTGIDAENGVSAQIPVIGAIHAEIVCMHIAAQAGITGQHFKFALLKSKESPLTKPMS